MSRIQLVAILGSILFLLFIFELIRRKQLKEAYALIWVIMGLAFLTLSCWLQGLHYLSELAGIFYAPATLFLVMLLTQTLILIQFSVVISRQSDKIRSMAQEIALLNERLRKMARHGEVKKGESDIDAE